MPRPDHNSTWDAYRRLLRFALPYKGRVIIALVSGLMVGGSLFGLLNLSPNLLRPFEEAEVSASGAEPAAADSGFEKDLRRVESIAARYDLELTTEDGRLTWQGMALALALFPVLAMVWMLANYLNRYYMRWLGARIVRDLRDAVFGHLQKQSLAFFGRCDTGRLISRCTNDAAVIENVVASTASEMIRAPVEIVAAVTFVVGFSVKQDMGLFMVFMLLLYSLCIIPVVILGHYVRRYTRQALSRISEVVSRMHENFTGVRVVKAFDMEERETHRFKTMNAGYFRSSIRALRAELLMTPMMEGLALLLAVIFLVACYANDVRLFQIVPICLAAVAAYKPIKQVARLNTNLQKGAAALERLFEILDTRTELPESPNPRSVEAFTDRILFDHVCFSYGPDSPQALSDIELEIPRGSVVALVGETGSGKTTMANLLARFYDPTRGRVLLDGVDIREIRKSDLRRLIGVVTQDTILFNDTIASNIAYGTDGATQEDIVEAARQANAHEYVMAVPEGYDRVVGEKGFVLSGGEKQRLAIARAILKNPPILILDEATSALDTVTESLVQEAIARVMKNRTVFAIAHRLSTVRNADLILVMAEGRIIERGTHDELYQANGAYRTLCDMQLS